MLRTLPGAPVHGVTTANPNPNPKVLDVGRLTFMLPKLGVGMACGHISSTKSCNCGGRTGGGEWGTVGGARAAPPWPTRPDITGCLLRYRKFFQSSSISSVQEAMVGIGRETGLRGQAEDVLCGCGQLTPCSSLNLTISLSSRVPGSSA